MHETAEPRHAIRVGLSAVISYDHVSLSAKLLAHEGLGIARRSPSPQTIGELFCTRPLAKSADGNASAEGWANGLTAGARIARSTNLDIWT
jgi:hypothetical protein